MTPEILRHIALLLAEGVLISGLLLVFIRLRDRFGLSLLCVTLGAFQHLQTQLAASLYVEVWPGVFISPGSSVLFTATLFATLLIYIRDDAVRARSLIVGIVAANLTLTLVVMLTQQHLADPNVAASAAGSMQLLSQNIGTLLAGTLLLCIDVFAIIVLYEFFFGLFRNSLFIRVTLAMLLVVGFDTAAFVGLNFHGDPAFRDILISGLIGKSAAAFFYSIVMVAYLKLVPALDVKPEAEPSELRDVFHILTYRQRYEILKDELNRDPMTGLFNRAFFNKNLPQEIQRASRLGHSMNLMLVDLDNFKRINDDHGHQTGDKVILLLADSMRELFRAADIPCRYGGEEFAVILPDSSAKAAFTAAHRLRRLLREKCRDADLPLPEHAISFTAGIATFPDDGRDPEALLKVADDRLYQGKENGRDRVVDSLTGAAPSTA